MAEGRGGASGPLCPAGQSQAAPNQTPSSQAAPAAPQQQPASGYLPPPALLICPPALPPHHAPARRDAHQRSLVPSQNQENGQGQDLVPCEPCGTEPLCPFHSQPPEPPHSPTWPCSLRPSRSQRSPRILQDSLQISRSSLVVISEGRSQLSPFQP